MSLAKLAIKQPIFITMVLLAVSLVGVLAYFNMGTELYPSMSAPMVAVTTSFPGASPEDVETQVTKPIEQALASMSGVDSIMSTSSQGQSMVMVSFVTDYDIQVGAEQVRESLDTVQRQLPSGAETPVLMRGNPNSQAFMIVAFKVDGNPSPTELRQLIEQVIEPRIQQVEGVASASVSGYDTEYVGVDLSASRLKALGVTPTEVTNALSSQNVAIPSGSITNESTKTQVRVSAELKTLDDISNIVVAQNGTQSIRIKDVASVSSKVEEKTNLIRVNGEDSMILSIQSQSGANIVDAASKTRAQLDQLSKEYSDINFYVLTDNSTFIQESIRDVLITMALGALLAFLIVFLFIRNFRNTLITVAGLPIVVLGTFAVISYLGFTVNIITLMALSLSIGLLIDDAIVVRENIFRHMEKGASPREAAESGTGEIAFAVLAITLTLVSIFIPLSFSGGMTGELFKEFGITVAVAVIISLFEAFTFAPLLTAFFAKALSSRETVKQSSHVKSKKSRNTWLSITTGYRSTLAWSISHRLVVVVIALVLVGGSVWSLKGMSMTYFPSTDEGQISISINLPPGSSLNSTDKIVREVEKVVKAQPEVEASYTQVGTRNSSYSGSVTVQLKNGADTDQVLTRMRQTLRQYGMSLRFSKPSQFMGAGGGLGSGMGGGYFMMPVQIQVKGPVDQETLQKIAIDIENRLKTVQGLSDIITSTPAQETEVEISVDRQRCALAGISASQVGTTISTLVNGTTATHMDWQGLRTDVRVQLRKQDRSDVASLLTLPVTSNNGTLYKLNAVANVGLGSGATALSRDDQQATITVAANLQGKTQAEVLPEIEKALEGIDMPAAVTWQYGGMQARAESAFSSLYFALLLGLVFIYMVLASQFGSFIHPFTVMAALPLAIVGGVAAILIGNTGLTIISGIGIILMLGIATKNSILLVDFIIRYRKQGHSRTDAILEAGPVRLRPILMTSIAIILGMIPTAIGWGASGSFRAPMAITVIGGVFTATLLSLVVVPVVYTLIDDFMKAVARLFNPNTALAAAESIAVDPLHGEKAMTDPEADLNAKNNTATGENINQKTKKQNNPWFRWFRNKK
jgi:hydrophobic/amphiphilic exporter-1 (mainly G- bacteria), HAE1 family